MGHGGGRIGQTISSVFNDVPFDNQTYPVVLSLRVCSAFVPMVQLRSAKLWYMLPNKGAIELWFKPDWLLDHDEGLGTGLMEALFKHDFPVLRSCSLCSGQVLYNYYLTGSPLCSYQCLCLSG
jgi:hypothetical protein